MNNNICYTAQHVLVGNENSSLMAMFTGSDCGWVGFDITNIEHHPSCDASRFKIVGQSFKTIFTFSITPEHASCNIRCFGYPNDCLHEINNCGPIMARPDLVYFQGYIKKRVSFKPGFSMIKGIGFYEINEYFQAGCSGSPVFVIKSPGNVWDIIGIYVGDKQVNDSPRLGYVLRNDQYSEWMRP
jgi:hypothetical protein